MSKFAKGLTGGQMALARKVEAAGLATFSQAVKAFERKENSRIEAWQKELEQSRGFEKGDRVKVKEYSRTRTIFVNAEVSPGESATYKGGWTGTVTNVFDDGFGGDIIEVLRDNSASGYYEFAAEEIEHENVSS